MGQITFPIFPAGDWELCHRPMNGFPFRTWELPITHILKVGFWETNIGILKPIHGILCSHNGNIHSHSWESRVPNVGFHKLKVGMWIIANPRMEMSIPIHGSQRFTMWGSITWSGNVGYRKPMNGNEHSHSWESRVHIVGFHNLEVGMWIIANPWMEMNISIHGGQGFTMWSSITWSGNVDYRKPMNGN